RGTSRVWSWCTDRKFIPITYCAMIARSSRGRRSSSCKRCSRRRFRDARRRRWLDEVCIPDHPSAGNYGKGGAREGVRSQGGKRQNVAEERGDFWSARVRSCCQGDEDRDQASRAAGVQV